MTFYQGTKQMKNAVLVAILTSAILVAATHSVSALTTIPVGNESELLSAMAIINAGTDTEYVINFDDNVFLLSPNKIELLRDVTVTLKLNQFNFQGAGSLDIEGIGTVNIVGSTTVFNRGFKVRDGITLGYSGIYTAGRVDVLGENGADDVTVNFTEPHSAWNARAAETTYIDSLPAVFDDYPDGTIVVGNEGKAVLNVSTGNWVENTETILGALASGDGTVNLTGNGTSWKGLGSFYVGYYGTGTLNVADSALLQVGAMEVGRMAGSNGTLNVSGKGTQLILFGRDDTTRSISDWSEGAGIMNITNNALVLFDHTRTLNETPSEFAPKITLGTGDSFVKNSQIIGKLAEGYFKEAAEATGKKPAEEAVTFDSFFGGNTELARITKFNDFFDQVGGEIIGSPGTTLTFQNNALLLGSLKVSAGTTTFTGGALLSPGFGSYDDHVSFGRIDFTGDFVHEDTAKTYIDFDVHGDSNFDAHLANYNLKGVVYEHGYLDNLGRDTINVNGNITLAGNVYFRPQSGYYSDLIDIHFMPQTGGTITGQYDLNIYPNRWFENVHFDTTSGDGNHLIMDRNATPFTNAANNANTRGVGGALDAIYNEQIDAPWLEVLNWVWLMNDDELRTAMRQLSGETRAASFHMPIKSPWKFAFDRVSWTKGGHNAIYFGQQNISNTRTSTNSLWANAFYDGVNMYKDSNVTSSEIHRASFMAGYDRALSYKSSIGVLFSHSQPRLQQGPACVEADDWLFGLHYANRFYEQYEVKLWAGYGTQQYRLRRSVPIPGVDQNLASNYTGNSVTASAMVASPYNWSNGVFRPFAALDLTYIQQNDTVEKGFQPIALRYESSDWTQFFGRIGVKTDFGWERWNLSTSLAYARLLAGHEAPQVSNDFYYVKREESFKVHGNNLGGNFLEFGLGAQIYTCRDGGTPSTSKYWERVKRDSMVFLQYNGSYGLRSNTQTASIGYQLAF